MPHFCWQTTQIEPQVHGMSKMNKNDDHGRDAHLFINKPTPL